MTEIESPNERSLAELIGEGDADACAGWLDSAERLDAVHTLTRLTDNERGQLLRLLEPAAAAEVVEQLPESQAIESIERLDAGTAARIIEELPSDDQADIVHELGATEAAAILDALDPVEAAEVRRLAEYDDHVAGGLMITELLSFRIGTTVRDVLRDLDERAEEYSGFNIQYTYVVGVDGALLGVLPLRELLLAPRSRLVEDLMIADPAYLCDTTSLPEIVSKFGDEPFLGLPVVDSEGRLVGVVERRAIQDAIAADADARYLQSQGIVGGEELRSMPLFLRSRRRLAWLSVNILLNILAASIIAMHQTTLEAVIALAVFLPIISDMSGCSGNQAVAVTMRELTLGVVRPADVFSVLLKELSVGLFNGLALGLLIGAVALAWKGNVYLGAVVGAALAINTMIAVAIGGTVPLVLKRFKMDPALASGPILTTMTDMCGFLLVLSLASAVLSRLQM